MSQARIDVLPLEFGQHAELGKAYDQWESLPTNDPGPLPQWNVRVLSDAPPALAPLAIVVDLVDDGADFRYRYWGSGMTRLYGRDKTDQLLSEAAGVDYIQATRSQLVQVIDRGTPGFFRLDVIKQSGLRVAKYNLRLPFAGPDGTLQHIVTFAVLADARSQYGEVVEDSDQQRLELLREFHTS